MWQACIIFGLVFLVWHLKDRWGKGSGFFLALFCASVQARAEVSEASFALLLEEAAKTNQHLENLTAILCYLVGLAIAFSLLHRLRLK